MNKPDPESQVIIEELEEGAEAPPPSTPEEPPESSLPQDGQDSTDTEPEGFTNPLLIGKTPAEIDRLFSTQERAVRSQNAELNRLHAATQAQPAAPQPEPEPDYGDDFLAPRFRTMEQRVASKVESMLKPLMTSLHQGTARDAREGARQKHRHFTALEPYIDQIIREQGGDPTVATGDQLELLYHTALGVAIANGVNLEPGAPAPAPTSTNRIPMSAPPQNRPSPAPMAPPAQPAVRPLTEDERVLARYYYPGIAPEESYRKYREEQERDEDAVVEPGFSREGW